MYAVLSVLDPCPEDIREDTYEAEYPALSPLSSPDLSCGLSPEQKRTKLSAKAKKPKAKLSLQQFHAEDSSSVKKSYPEMVSEHESKQVTWLERKHQKWLENPIVVCGKSRDHGVFRPRKSTTLNLAETHLLKTGKLWFDNTGRECSQCLEESFPTRVRTNLDDFWQTGIVLCPFCRERGLLHANQVVLREDDTVIIDKVVRYIERTAKRWFVAPKTSGYMCKVCEESGLFDCLVAKS